MKKIIILICLICFNTYAQDVAFFTKIRNLDDAGVENLAIEIADMTRNKFKIAKKDETESELVITLVKSDLSNEDVKKALEGTYPNPDVVFDVVFEKFMEGQNKALEIKGVKKYKFYGVIYNYLDLFPFWQKYFAPDATKELTLTDLKLQRSQYKESGNWWLYKFQMDDARNPKIWKIIKFY